MAAIFFDQSLTRLYEDLFCSFVYDSPLIKIGMMALLATPSSFLISIDPPCHVCQTFVQTLHCDCVPLSPRPTDRPTDDDKDE